MRPAVVKFTPPGGFVIVQAEPAGDALVHNSVTDTGIGIPSDRLKAVFDPFVRWMPA